MPLNIHSVTSGRGFLFQTVDHDKEQFYVGKSHSREPDSTIRDKNVELRLKGKMKRPCLKRTSSSTPTMCSHNEGNFKTAICGSNLQLFALQPYKFRETFSK